VENSLQNATVRDAQVPLDDRNEGFHFVVSDLVSLIDRVQASIQLIETAQAQEDGADGELGDIIVLDDVTPLYAKASAALDACNARLSAALQFLTESTTPGLASLTRVPPRGRSRPPAAARRPQLSGRSARPKAR
jgi:hypothetical protein